MQTTTRGIATLVAAGLMSWGLVSPTATAQAPTTPVRIDASSDHAPIEVPGLDAFQRVVAPSECALTPLDHYFAELAAELSAEQFAFAVEHLDTLFLVPTYDSLFLSTAGDPDYALGPQAQQLWRTFRDLTRFWSDVRSDDIQVVGMRGDVLLDADRIAASLNVMIKLGAIAPMAPEEIATEASTVAAFMATQGDFHQSPLWTFGAYAFTGDLFTDPEIAALPDKIVIGDGIIEAYEALGLGDVGPSVVLAHEFAHQVQFELGTYDTGPADPGEATRRTELMADAMAVYHGAHKKGLAMNSKRVVNALLTFYNVGGCAFDDPAHHGTPLQRQRAAAWGADLAAAARPRSLVLPSEVVTERFDASLPGVVAGN